MASAGAKLLNLKNKPKVKQWSPVNNSKKDLPKKDLSKIVSTPRSESKRELDGLINMSKVSAFKQNVDEKKIDEEVNDDKHPLEKINEIIKNSKPDIEMGAINVEDSIKKNKYSDHNDDGEDMDNKEDSREVRLKIDFLDKITD